MKRIIDRKLYDTDAAVEIASDSYWDGSNLDRGGCNTYLYRTENGAYFVKTTSMWEGEHDDLYPVTRDSAIDLYEGQLRHDQSESFDKAFPGVEVVDA